MGAGESTRDCASAETSSRRLGLILPARSRTATSSRCSTSRGSVQSGWSAEASDAPAIHWNRRKGETSMIKGRATTTGTANFADALQPSARQLSSGARPRAQLNRHRHLSRRDMTRAPMPPMRNRSGSRCHSGLNLIDTAVNYRLQRSERVIGQVLQEPIDAGTSQARRNRGRDQGRLRDFRRRYASRSARVVPGSFRAPGIVDAGRSG